MSGPTFVYVTYIAMTPQKLWQALTDKAFTRQYWSGIGIESDWIPGAALTFRSGSGEVMNTGEVLEADPYRRLSYTWRVEFDEVFRREKPSRVTFDLEPGERTAWRNPQRAIAVLSPPSGAICPTSPC